ncbi:hypothetical protein CEY04_22965 [Achromobacter sp. HZ28]|nr:hypothetical protein CEY05_24130 [Achromobacter sp. HZ34]OWT74185.1 hypothetical protein CEY04_22965 [Achromobacter sp. HZ28]
MVFILVPFCWPMVVQRRATLPTRWTVCRAGLTARLEALDAEAGEVRRYQAIKDRAETRRDAVRSDPVTARLATIFSITDATLDLLVGLAFAAVLEGMACLLWWIALLPSSQTFITDSLAVAATAPPAPEPSPAIPEPDTELTKLVRDIQAGIVSPTVSGIRQHLRCSQAKAAAFRRQLASATS